MTHTTVRDILTDALKGKNRIVMKEGLEYVQYGVEVVINELLDHYCESSLTNEMLISVMKQCSVDNFTILNTIKRIREHDKEFDRVGHYAGKATCIYSNDKSVSI